MTHAHADFGDRVTDETGAFPEQAQTTGRQVVVLSDAVHGDEAAMMEALRSAAGIRGVARSTEFTAGALDVQQAEGAEAMLFTELGIAVVPADPDRVGALTAAAAEDERIEAIEPEKILYATTGPAAIPLDYLRGFRDAANELYEHANHGNGGVATEVAAVAEFVDTAAATWGLQATNVLTSTRNGHGVPVAMLDTGFDLQHPDFAGRRITTNSFIPGESVQDGHGHGTHVTGTSSGPKNPPGGHRRYGVAFGDNIFVGKVLNNEGRGSDTNILAGMNWAINNRCRVISMSLGAPVCTSSVAYEAVGRRALAAGTLVVAAAGNNADRAHNKFGCVEVPANSPSIMAVGALDSRLRIANFSARSNGMVGGQVDIAAPGVLVDSSWPMEHRYKIISGTSMATPHVAGIAALWSEARNAAGAELWAILVRSAQRLPLPSVDVGAGLAQAPQE